MPPTRAQTAAAPVISRRKMRGPRRHHRQGPAFP